MSGQLLASPLLPSSPHPTKAVSSIIHYPHSLWLSQGIEGTEGENKLTWGKAMVRVATCGLCGTGWVQVPCACCLLQTTLRAPPICHPEAPRKCCPPQHPPAAGARPSQGFSGGQLPLAAWDLQGWPQRWPQHIPASCNPTDLSFNVTAVSHRIRSESELDSHLQAAGLKLSFSNLLSLQSLSPRRFSAPVAIRTPNCQAGMAVTNLSLCLYTPLSLCQIQQSLWDANAFTPTCFV